MSVRKIYSIIIGTLLVVLPIASLAQSLDSLKQSLNSVFSVAERSVLLDELSWLSCEGKHDSAVLYAQRTLAYAQANHLLPLRIKAHLQLADAWSIRKDFEQATESLSAAKKLLVEPNNVPRAQTHVLLVRGKLAYRQSQIKEAESLLKEGLDDCPEEAIKLKRALLTAVANVFIVTNELEEAEKYLQKHLKLRTAQDSIVVFSKLGIIQARQQNYKQAQHFYEMGLTIAHRQRDYVRESRAALNVGNVHLIEGRWSQALHYYTRSTALKKQLGDEKGLAILHNNIATIYKDQERYLESLEYYEKSRLYYSEVLDTVELANSWINIAVVKILLGEFQEGIDLLRQALPIINREQDASTRLVIHINMAFAYKNIGKYQLALNYLKTAEEEAREQDDLYSKNNIANLYGDCYLKLGAYKRALDYYSEAWNLGQELDLLMEQQVALFGLYQTELALENYQTSLEWLEQCNIVDDSLNVLQNNQRLLDLQEQYDAQQKEQEIGRLNVINRNAELENELQAKQINLLALLTVFALVLAIVVMFFVFYRQRQQKNVLAQAKVLHKEKINQLMDTQALTTLNAVLSAQQKEREQLAKEVHDTLGSYLATIKYQHEAGKTIEEAENPQYKIMEGLIDQAHAEVRAVAHQLATGEQLNFNLMAAIETLIKRIKNTQQFDIDFDYFGVGGRLSQRRELLLYRIIQELFSNILKHAEASEVSLQINQSETDWTIILEDDGKGFELTRTANNGLGLRSVAERVEQLQGSLEIDSHLGRGTTIIMTIFNVDE